MEMLGMVVPKGRCLRRRRMTQVSGFDFLCGDGVWVSGSFFVGDRLWVDFWGESVWLIFLGVSVWELVVDCSW